MSKIYSVKEIYYTIQGEGLHTGRPAIFCRFSGCNLWNGLEKDRYKAICQFCDTNFWDTDGYLGGKYLLEELVETVKNLWNSNTNGLHPYIIFTGGEPLLQLDAELTSSLQIKGYEVAVETNGTIIPDFDIDWICVSPKAGAEWKLKKGNELKLVYPQINLLPEKVKKLKLDFDYYFLQPLDSMEQDQNLLKTIVYCKSNPKWRLSIQTHKILNLP